MYNDLKRAEFVIENMKLHNPDIPITVYNGGQSFPHLTEMYGVEVVEGPNLWHTRVRNGSSFSVDWFDNFYGFAEKYNPEYMIFLETDVKCNHKITRDPTYDMSGPMHHTGPMENFIVYDYWVNYLNGLEPLGGWANPWMEIHQSRWPFKIHTGMGGTAFSREYFAKTKDKLHIVKQCFKDIPLWFQHDLIISCFARHCGCSIGDWKDATDVRGSMRNIDGQWYGVPYEPECALVHFYKV